MGSILEFCEQYGISVKWYGDRSIYFGRLGHCYVHLLHSNSSSNEIIDQLRKVFKYG